MTRLALIPVALMLTACVPAYLALRAANSGTSADTCGAADRQDRVGQPVQPSSDLPPGTRVIRPGDAVTEDFSESRLNVFVDSQDIVTSLTCG
jgi:hypothetical protein